MHGQFRHTLCLSKQASKWAVSAVMGNQLSCSGKAATWQLIGHYPFRWSFGFVLTLNQIYFTTMHVDNSLTRSTLIYLTNLLWKLGLDSELHYFSIFHGE